MQRDPDSALEASSAHRHEQDRVQEQEQDHPPVYSPLPHAGAVFSAAADSWWQWEQEPAAMIFTDRAEALDVRTGGTRAQQSGTVIAAEQKPPDTPDTPDTPDAPDAPDMPHASDEVANTRSHTQTQPLPSLRFLGSKGRPPFQGPVPRRLLLLGSAVMLLMLLSAAVFTTVFPPASVLDLVGTVSFRSSGQIDATGTTGLNDIVQVELHDVTPPASGQVEAAWLLPDQGDDVTPPLSLGTLRVAADGMVQVRLSSRTHQDWLASYSRFLITEQPAASLPAGPSPDPATWRYEGAIPDMPVPGDPNRYSLLDHVRHLLAKDPELEAIGLHGGLALWTTRNTEKVLEWSSAAQGDWNGGQATASIHRQVIRILDYLDGTAFVGQDVPPGTPVLVNPTTGRIGLVQLAANQPLPSYLDHINQHLAGLAQAPGHTAAQQQLATAVYQEVLVVETHLAHARQDALQLVRMNPTQLQQQQALMLLDDLVSQANAAYVGQPDAEGVLHDGVTTMAARLHSSR